MRQKFNKVIHVFTRSFPIQLVLVNLKQNYMSMLVWAILFGFISKSLGSKFGVPYLFLDPEYMNEVGFTSFFILGFALAGFLMTINLSTYINYGIQFPHLGGIKNPFTIFSLNNCILFICFIVYYVYQIIDFQYLNEFQGNYEIIKELGGLCAGMFLFTLFAYFYFKATNTDIFRVMGAGITKLKPKNLSKVVLNRNFQWQQIKTRTTTWNTGYYIDSFFKIKHTDDIPPFELNLLKKVINRNQVNAVVVQLASLLVLISLSYFSDYKFFQIPAGASLLILFSTIVMLTGAITFWIKGWQILFWIIFFGVISFLNQFEWFNNPSTAYGLNYSTKQPYTNAYIKQLCDEHYTEDSMATIKILQNWKIKNQSKQHKTKPVMILVSASGGGQRAALLTFESLYMLDSLTNSAFFNATAYISGASGGALGAAYYRELKRTNSNSSFTDNSLIYVKKLGKDVLNPIALSIAVNDIFIPFRKASQQDQNYYKNRAFALELGLDENTDGVLSKHISVYAKDEQLAQIPMMTFSPTILEDGRKLIISSSPIAYLCKSSSKSDLIDGVDFSRLFNVNNAKNLNLLTALRMSASFPYISPKTILPTSPSISVMDAGLRDNLGGQNLTRFLLTFSEWLNTNTSKVILLQIRDTPYQPQVVKEASRSVLANAFDPIAGFYSNFERFQQYDFVSGLTQVEQRLDVPFETHIIQYGIDKTEQIEASISWHLTSLEKQSLYNAMRESHNLESVANIAKSFKE